MADISGMVLHETLSGMDFYALNESGVHVAYYPSRGYSIRWQFESGDSIMSDGYFANICNMEKHDYITLMLQKYNANYFCGIYFENQADCQLAIDEVIEPAALASVMIKNQK